MVLGGIQKLSLLDYPGKICCTVFTVGCNFACPYCHNSGLISFDSSNGTLSEDEFFSFLKSRVGKLEAVTVTGGEPLLQKDLKGFLSKIKDLGFLIKLDTNGSSPDLLKDIIDSGLVDYVAMDVKSSKDNFSAVSGSNILFDNIVKSIDILIGGDVDYEFRTTVVKEFHTEKNISDIAQLIKGTKKYFIQNYRESDENLYTGLTPFSDEELENLLLIAQKTIINAELRGN